MHQRNNRHPARPNVRGIHSIASWLVDALKKDRDDALNRYQMNEKEHRAYIENCRLKIVAMKHEQSKVWK